MHFIDSILNSLGLQRKSQASMKPAQQDTTDAMVNSISEMSSRMFQRGEESVSKFLEVAYELKFDMLDELTEKMRRREHISQQEIDRYMRIIFGESSVGDDLSPSVKQALIDALEKRGREDKDTPE